MLVARIRAAALAVTATLSLGACHYGNGYGGGGLSVGYGSAGYYGGHGYGGYGGYGGGYGGYGGGYGGYGYGSPSYFGWYNGFYYPGTGFYIYDRYRRPYRWSDHHRRYWEGRRHHYWGDRRTEWRHFRGDVDRRNFRGEARTPNTDRRYNDRDYRERQREIRIDQRRDRRRGD